MKIWKASRHMFLLMTLYHHAQSQAPPQSMPARDDTGAILYSTARLNNLEQGEGQPWHLKATYEIFDHKGKPQSSGFYEEWWVNPRKNKRTLTTKGFSRTDYSTEHGMFSSESGKTSFVIANENLQYLVRPLSEENFDDFTQETHEEHLSGMPLKCITLTWHKGAPVVPIAHIYCIDPDRKILRTAISEYGLSETLYNHIIQWRERYVAKDIRIVSEQKPLANIHLEQIEDWTTVSDADLTPPVDAKLIDPLAEFSVKPELTPRRLVRKVYPEYPRDAREARVQGTLKIGITVTKDGRVENPQIVSGIPALNASALAAVSQWEYMPFLSNHRPIQAKSEITVVFTLGP